MFDISWGELLIIGMVALVVIGPKELPGVLRTVGQWMAKVRRMAAEFQDQFREAMREAELEELKKKVDDLGTGAAGYTNFDPIGTIRKEFENTVGEPPRLDDPLSEPKPAGSMSESPASASSTAASEPALPQPKAEPSAPVPAGVAETRKPGDAA
jgi:sec-independent protein translocase protein TatB